ncbi:hypothetical protein TKWG_20070 [Advenella kashmirensis WT001]|uniref:Uncharacterized protein n=1 Tax=Advenella kashmirensis (strain DSM 17095 / LMG 22695 / WT001) TaxID=1036672 RepID=I3UFJ8_ADVKW|nr:hypothetical protein [Advenella kashmirensis]AFK63786.1 hypothetical protein TKWG_20070 [Advenella kashmirensis WT001]
MMNFPMTLNWLCRLAERMYGTTEVVTKMPMGNYAGTAMRKSQRAADAWP